MCGRYSRLAHISSVLISSEGDFLYCKNQRAKQNLKKEKTFPEHIPGKFADVIHILELYTSNYCGIEKKKIVYETVKIISVPRK